jgi:muramoyltetrapeptide carboxypeptidase
MGPGELRNRDTRVAAGAKATATLNLREFEGLAAKPFRIGVVATASRMSPEVADKVCSIAAARYPADAVGLIFHPDTLVRSGHFAGGDATRARAFLEMANDPAIDAVWIARGGYGSGRIAETVLAGLTDVARAKAYLGYSDAGALLGALYRAGLRGAAHGPVAQDVLRPGGEAAILRALAWLVDRDPATLEPSLRPGQEAAAYNLIVLSQLIGTAMEPDLSDHVLMLEEVSEAMYRIDRSFLHITSTPNIRRVAGIRLGRCSDIPPNDPDFGMTAQEVARFWCARSGIPWLGVADIGHDADNKIVPFGGTG